MTQHIGRAYRKNRRMSWLVAGLAVLVAAVAIPVAWSGGGSEKTYTLGPSTQALCMGDSGAVTLTLTNTARSASLGSANITIPSTVQVTGVSAKKGTTTLSSSNAYVSGNKVSLRNLSLSKGGSVNVTVTVTVPDQTASTKSITAVVKQSSNFNDSGDDDSNLFKNPSTWPTLEVKGCYGTIEGTVWNDKNESGDRPATDAPFEPQQANWTVKLYEVGTSTTLKASTTTNASGAYKLEKVLLGKAYVVCEQKPTGDTRTWGQTTPTTPSAACSSVDEPNGIDLGTFTASVTGKDFGNIETASLVCGGSVNSNPGFEVAAGAGDNCKSTQTGSTEYVYEKWVEGTRQIAAFHPVTGEGACDLGGGAGTCTYFVERLEWSDASNEQDDPAGRTLKYDDAKNTSGEFTYEAMKFCKTDPRMPGEDFDLEPLGSPADVAADVLPNGLRADGDPQTSCLITTTESTGAGGPVQRVDYVFTAVDGRIAFPG